MIPALVLLAATSFGCAPHGQLLEQLGRSGYVVVGAGPVDGGSVLVEIYVDRGGNWVAVLTRAADQLSCIKAVGTDWRSPPPGEPA